MPAGDIKVLEKVMDSISDVTDYFIVLSVHDDVDVLVRKEYKDKVIEVLDNYGFDSYIKNWDEVLTKLHEEKGSWDTRKGYLPYEFGEIV